MQVKNRILISAHPRVIWPYIADPTLVARWNPNIIKLEREATGPVSTGETYQETAIMMGDEPRGAQVIVQRATEPRLLTLRYLVRYHPSTTTRVGKKTWTHTADKERTSIATISFRLEERADGTRLTQSIDLSQAAPKFVQWLIWLLSVIGSTPDKTTLQRLKEAVEQGVAYPAYVPAEVTGEAPPDPDEPDSFAGGKPLTNMQWLKVTRDDQDILEIQKSSSVWLFIGLIIATMGLGRLIYLLAVTRYDWHAMLPQVALPIAIGLVAMAFSRTRSVFRFDQPQQLFRWQHTGPLRRKSEQYRFDEITDVRIRLDSDSEAAGWDYHLEIQTPQGLLQVGYAGNKAAHQELIELADRLRYILAIRPD